MNAMNREIRKEVLELMSKKDKIEQDIKALTEILTLNGVGMNEPLVDSEGYPKNNIDVYQVRHARNRIICLQNDHKAIMKQIENGLHGYYAATKTSSSDHNTDIEMPPESERPEFVVHRIPFAKINLVTPESPAAFAGLQVDDELVEFGSVNSRNFKNLTDVAAVVQHSEGNKLNLKIKRGDHFVSLQLIPKKWAGKGLLGCNIVPL